MSAASDYTVDELNSFSSWTFTNIKKNSNVSGIKLNTTSANNSAVTAMCSKGSLVIMANARVGFDLTVTSPLATPFKLKNGGSGDLSAYDGFVLSASGLGDNLFELTVGKGDDWCMMDIFIQRSTDGGETFGDPIYIAKGTKTFATTNRF